MKWYCGMVVRMEKKRRQQSWSFVAKEATLVDWPRIAGFL
jgi:hypothetical protein